MPDHPRTEPSLIDRLRGVAARLLDRTPAGLRLGLSGRRPIRVDGQTLDPTLQMALALRPREDRPRLILEDPVRARANLRRVILAVQSTPTAVGRTDDVSIAGPAGALAARLYVPDGVRRPPLLVYFHGGGFTQGDLDTHDEPCRILCREAGQAVLSVDYRLAPEHPFPAAIEDASGALRWAQENAGRLGADPGFVAVGGDSAGGNLAAVVAQLTRDDRPPAGQLLIYPSADRITDRPSRHLFDGFFLPEAEREAFHHVYTAGTGVSEQDPRISPMYGRLGGLAPALVVTAGFDVLRDEGEAYAAALRDAGTRVEDFRESAMGHGFINLTGVSRAARLATVRIAHRWRDVVNRQRG